MLDEAMRQRLRGLALQDTAPALDDAARERVLRAVRVDGPPALRRARRSRAAYVVAGPVLAAAAAAALIWGSPQARLEQKAEETVAVESTSGQLAVPACAEWEPQVARDAAFVAERDGQRLRLGRLGVAAAPASAKVRLAEASACRTVLGLETGQIVVHAAELGGGTLRIDAGRTQVEVHGTLFSVERSDQGVFVDVFEGVVSVERDGQREGEELRAGERFAATHIGTARGRVSEEREVQARALVESPRVIGLESLEHAEAAADVPELEPPVAPPPRARVGKASAARGDAPGDLLARAERLRRGGNYEAARALYTEVGGASGATAEAAWLALARMELSLGRADAAGRAAQVRRERFGGGSLGPEAQWLEVRIHRQAGRGAEARRAAKELVRQWPTSPQAAAAKRWLALR